MNFKKAELTFFESNNIKIEIAQDSEVATTSFLGEDASNSLDKLRYVKYLQKLKSQKKPIHPSSLPPTSSSCRFHSYRVKLQILIWNNLFDETEIDPTDWGWDFKDGKLFPIYI